jgi:hypothetical protein
VEGWVNHKVRGKGWELLPSVREEESISSLARYCAILRGSQEGSGGNTSSDPLFPSSPSFLTPTTANHLHSTLSCFSLMFFFYIILS